MLSSPVLCPLRGCSQGGLAKLQEAGKTVNELEAHAVVQRAELQEKTAEADDSMDGITSALKLAEQTRQETEKLSVGLKVAKGELQDRKGAIDEELSEIQPVLESAKEAVSGIKSDNLNEIRSFKMPPEASNALTLKLAAQLRFRPAWHHTALVAAPASNAAP